VSCFRGKTVVIECKLFECVSELETFKDFVLKVAGREIVQISKLWAIITKFKSKFVKFMLA
jgi:hypothetical protein